MVLRHKCVEDVYFQEYSSEKWKLISLKLTNLNTKYSPKY